MGEVTTEPTVTPYKGTDQTKQRYTVTLGKMTVYVYPDGGEFTVGDDEGSNWWTLDDYPDLLHCLEGARQMIQAGGSE